ncbi:MULTISPECIES: Zn-dependent oxidoreductase/NADPH2:quinone reductase [unclassified Haloferax]|uniref:Zn-dependent oxidoreductase/NADPH2:quinone reductase n=1 Tax=Haloferax TaxID=2251 RepID=UPI0002B1CACD|nr:MULTISPECIES: Zn-dependent oxidoreductase/NADPH2:quinone reductase [unclassified Haloferax]ELZ61373.1 Zn-dependent oxidoreductase/NADPH2:quinone reductase [Haloferax sp. ATCC BAA-645]ELZ61629.1 Zn-dependent oxidoreductase/NADPH2:quinone reductase [Haloferax sp. ATCC BAA-646]ELZ71385.1 Zn-dependent oxidoreductase/NADPH2:quinone reductase [Haloferax sp. ATCC BAA-644]
MTDSARCTVVFVGIPLEPEFPTDIVETIGQEYDQKGSFRFSNTYPEAIEGIETGRFDVDSIVTFESSFEDTQATFDRAAELRRRFDEDRPCITDLPV